MTRRVKLILGGVLVVLAAIVVLQNSGPIELRFLFWRATVDGLLLYCLLFVLGAACGALLTLARRRRGGT